MNIEVRRSIGIATFIHNNAAITVDYTGMREDTEAGLAEELRRAAAEIEDKQRLDACGYPPHCIYGSKCCGVFMDVRNNELVCNECGMSLSSLMDSLRNKPTGPAEPDPIA